jgi:predicted ATP-grasp superfamily ATP-dependent carboligase
MPYSILILDGETRSALAATRALGKDGHNVTVASSQPSLASKSKFCKNALTYPNPSKEPEAFRRWVIEELKKNTYDVLLPVTDLSLSTLYDVESEVRAHTVFPFSDKSVFEEVRNKFCLIKKAEQYSIRSPKTLLVRHGDSLDTISLPSTPSVLKPVETLVSTERGMEKVGALYVQTIGELRKHLEKYPEGEFLLQEHIEGTGVGVSVLFDDGRVLAHASHKRLLEKPPSGGVSVLSESIKTNQNLLGNIKLLLSSIHFRGVAMVEFKQTPSGEFILMEINPRFWGSLQLAIDAQVNFPCLLVETALNHTSSKITEGREGQRLRWELGCVDHGISMLKMQPVGFLKKVLLSNYFSLFSNTRPEILRLDDPRPFSFEMRAWILNAFT